MAAAGEGAGAAAAVTVVEKAPGYVELQAKGVECCCFEPSLVPEVVCGLWGLDENGLLSTASEGGASGGGWSGAHMGGREEEGLGLSSMRMSRSIEEDEEQVMQRVMAESMAESMPTAAGGGLSAGGFRGLMAAAPPVVVAKSEVVCLTAESDSD